MSVLCTHLPNLLLTLTHQAQPHLVGRPLALLDADERITALSTEAVANGVTRAMTPPRAQLTCPEILFQDLNLPAFTQTQEALLAALGAWELPTEEAGWGLAYVDLHQVTTQRTEVQQLAADMGGRLRRLLGPTLQPAVGWDSGKFTAKAAAVRTPPGRMKLIDAAREVPFLQPLPITLLPLPSKQLRWLHRLGIHTLGQFSALPPLQIQTAMGKQGVTIQQWAQGKDARPVVDTLKRRFDPIGILFPHPTNRLPQVVTGVMETIAPQLERWAASYRGVRRLVLDLHFEADERRLKLTFVEPTSRTQRIENHLTNQLQQLSWPGYLSQITIADLQTAELTPPTQLGLFDELTPAVDNPQAWLAGLRERYGAIGQRGQLVDATHPVAQFRAQLKPL